LYADHRWWLLRGGVTDNIVTVTPGRILTLGTSGHLFPFVHLLDAPNNKEFNGKLCEINFAQSVSNSIPKTHKIILTRG